MDTLFITPKSKAQETEFRALAEKFGLRVSKLNKEEEEDAVLLKAIVAVENNKLTVTLDTFLSKLRS